MTKIGTIKKRIEQMTKPNTATTKSKALLPNCSQKLTPVNGAEIFLTTFSGTNRMITRDPKRKKGAIMKRFYLLRFLALPFTAMAKDSYKRVLRFRRSADKAKDSAEQIKNWALQIREARKN